MINLGLGQHVTEVLPENELKQLKVLYICYVLYDISITFPKISALLFYARVFSTRSKFFRVRAMVHSLPCPRLVHFYHHARSLPM